MLREKLKNDGGFTVDPATRALVTKGFALSVNPERTRIIDGPVDTITLNTYERDNLDMWGEGKVFGAWLDTETGKTYLDVVTLYTDREEAVKYGRFYGEIAIFDLSKGEEIRLSYEVGGPDPYPWDWDGPEMPEDPGCDAAQNFLCTMSHNHNSPHVAGNGSRILEVWDK